MLMNAARPVQLNQALAEPRSQECGRPAQTQRPSGHIALVRKHRRIERWYFSESRNDRREALALKESLILKRPIPLLRKDELAPHHSTGRHMDNLSFFSGH